MTSVTVVVLVMVMEVVLKSRTTTRRRRRKRSDRRRDIEGIKRMRTRMKTIRLIVVVLLAGTV